MLTRQGWGVLAISLIGVAIGRIFGVLELFLLGSGLITLVFCCLIWVRLRPVSLSVHRRILPDQLQVGDVGRVELNVTNTGRVGTSSLGLWEPVVGIGGASLRLAPLRRGESANASYRLPANKRGTVTFGPLTAERRDPFGLARVRRLVAGVDEIVVLPTHYRLFLPSGSSGAGPLGNLLRVRSLTNSGTEFRSLREYNEGDDLRTVSWRASARSDSLLVRELEPDSLRRCTVVLDLDSAQFSEEGFERAVSAAASAVVTVAQAGLELRLIAGSLGDFRNTHPQAALRQLADCAMETGQAGDASPAKSPTGEGLGLIIVVTGSANAPIVERVGRNLSSSDVLVTVACTTMSGAHRGFVLDATADDMFQSSWANLTGHTSRQITLEPR